jgi:ABC-type lipoprotein release transport system permease subunit
MLAWKIAWRNIWRHRGKSLVVGTILFLGALLMTVGNAVIKGANEGIARNLVERFAGHLVLVPAEQKEDSVLAGGMRNLKILADYPAVKAILADHEMVEAFAPMTRGLAMILNPDGDQREIFVFGINFDEYQRTFLNNLKPLEGQLLEGGRKGLIITQRTRERIFDRQKFWVVPKGLTAKETVLYRDPARFKEATVDNPETVAKAQARATAGDLKTVDELIVMGFGSNAFGRDIIVPVTGIFQFESLHHLWQDMSFMDIESFREAFGYISAAAGEVNLSAEETALLDTDTAAMDDLFGASDSVETSSEAMVEYDLDLLKAPTETSTEMIDIDQGVYNYVAVKLNVQTSISAAQAELQQALDDAGLPVRVVIWEDAVGAIAQFAAMGQAVLSVFVLFIFFVAIIVIMNTLSMAALERVTEIGMMRAIGARKGFIGRMFAMETASLSFLFGGLGILLGAGVSLVLAAMKIPVTQNEMLSLLFGSDTFKPVVSGGDLVSGVVQLAVVTLLAVLYPLIIARKISPLEAIARD